MKFIKVTNAKTPDHDPVLLNLDSISWITKDGCLYQVMCAGSDIHVDPRDYQRILTALGIQ